MQIRIKFDCIKDLLCKLSQNGTQYNDLNAIVEDQLMSYFDNS